MAEPACIVCMPGSCPHTQLELVASPLSLEEQLAFANERIALLTDMLDATRAELKTANDATKRAWEILGVFEREVARAYRRAKKRSGSRPKKPERPRVRLAVGT